MTRIQPGATISPFEVETLSHGRVTLPAAEARLTHLSFRRFAGCPVCNLHLRSLAARVDEIQAAGVAIVAFFHSSAEAMRPYQGDLPFAVVPDPERRLYRQFGVERSPFAVMHPKAMAAAAAGMLQVASNPLRGEGGHDGLPADLLLDASGHVVAAHYGAHAADGWNAEALLAQVRAAG